MASVTKFRKIPLVRWVFRDPVRPLAPSMVLAGIALVSALAVACSSSEKSDSPAALPDSEQNAADRSAGGAPASDESQPELDRKIIQTTTLDLRVDNVAEAHQSVVDIASAAGGFVLQASLSLTGDSPRGGITLRVPSSQYDSVVSRIRGLATEVEKESVKSEDVTGEYTDVQARIRTAQAREARYLEMLGQAQTIPEMLQVEDRLAQVRLEIEQLQGRSNTIDTLSELVTVVVNLNGPPPEEESKELDLNPLETARDAWGGSLTFLRGVAVAVVGVTVFFWWLAPLGIIGAPIALFFDRRRRRNRSS
jgi:hypothetical protein